MSVQLNDYPFLVNTLQVDGDDDGDGEVMGYAQTDPIPEITSEYRITATVVTHMAGEMRHIPLARVIQANGRIEHEQSGQDVLDPETAIEQAKAIAEDIYDNPEYYLQDHERHDND